MLQLLTEEEISDDHSEEYVERLYRVVCVSERPSTADMHASLVRTTYVVDWEQLVHLLESYTCFGEDIVELSAYDGEQSHLLRAAYRGSLALA